jgi:hypothetical protein
MSNSNFIRLSGWAFIVGAVLVLPGALMSLLWGTRYQLNLDASLMPAMAFASWLAPILLAVGLLGLRSRYGREAGALGRWVLLGGAAVGSAMVSIGLLGMWFAASSATADSLWLAWALGLLLLLGTLFVFGIVALVRQPLPRWNWLPLVAGAWPILVLVVVTIAGQLTLRSGLAPAGLIAPAILIAGVVIMIFALILLGYVLQSDARRDQPAFA